MGRKIGSRAVVEQRHAAEPRTWLPGTDESEMPTSFVETLGDHVWAGPGEDVPVVAGPAPDPADATRAVFEGLGKAELQMLCDLAGLASTGNKGTLITRLLRAGVDPENPVQSNAERLDAAHPLVGPEIAPGPDPADPAVETAETVTEPATAADPEPVPTPESGS